LIREKDLIKNIEKFSFVGLDVLEDEVNFDSESPLLKYPKVFITPHIAYKSEVTTKERWEKTFECIKDFLK
jgi:phosphoglycerate dehydrogenase-like enzyme